MRAVLAAAGVVLVGALAGCILFTGGTNGYTATEAGAPSGATCESPSDCSGGQFCCAVLADGGLPGSACLSSCPRPYEQVCAHASDCGEAGACLTQMCTFEGTSYQVNTCGAIPMCTQ